jgi:hypothetical protein
MGVLFQTMQGRFAAMGLLGDVGALVVRKFVDATYLGEN